MSVDGPGPAVVERFDLRIQDSTVIQFVVRRLELNDGGLPAAHLREHLVSGEPITVDYELRDGRYVALRYTDAE